MEDKPYVVEATALHVEQMAPNVREADRQELWAAAAQTPLQALTMSLEHSSKAWAVIYQDQVAMMFGVADTSTALDSTGVPWMIGTPALEEFQFTFLRHCKEYVSQMEEGFDLLVNYIDSRNTTAIQWLRWLGFKIEKAVPFGVFQVPFHRFEKRIERCAA